MKDSDSFQELWEIVNEVRGFNAGLSATLRAIPDGWAKINGEWVNFEIMGSDSFEDGGQYAEIEWSGTVGE